MWTTFPPEIQTMKILFASDFHGNEQHLVALQQEVAEFEPDVFVYAGDFSPCRLLYKTAKEVDEYNLKYFFPII